MPFRKEVLSSSSVIEKTEIFDDKKYSSDETNFGFNRKEVSWWTMGMLLASPVEQNYGAQNKQIRGYQYDIDTGTDEPVYGRTNATFRIHLRGQPTSKDFLRQECTTDPNANKPYQVSTVQHFWKSWGLHYSPVPDKFFKGNACGQFKEDSLAKIKEHRDDYSPELEKYLRNGLLGIMPYANVRIFINHRDFELTAGEKLGLTGSNLAFVKEAVRHHNFGLGELGDPTHNPCEISGVPGYRGYGESLVVSFVGEDYLKRARRIEASYKPPEALKLSVWERDDWKCLFESKCLGLKHGSSFMSLTCKDAKFGLSRFDDQFLNLAIKELQNCQISIEHLIPIRLCKLWGYTDVHTLENCLSVCTYCNSGILGDKHLGEKMQILADCGVTRGDKLTIPEIAEQIARRHSNDSVVKHYIYEQLGKWI